MLSSSIRGKNGQNEQRANGDAVAWVFIFLEREREHLLSRITVDRTVGFRRSKKESCSTWRGLRVDTNLVEFRQLKEVGIFSYLC